ncbi:hypothetical protein GCM10028895_40880 [Pontibacter rugosus]
MKANTYTFILWLLLITAPALAQDTIQVPLLHYSHSIPTGSATAISLDRAGNVYLLDKNMNVLRLDALGRPIDTFSPPARGRFNSIHAWNPMKIVLFYEGSQQLVLLDRFLRPISTTDLLNLDYYNTAKLVAPANDQGYWLFDETNATLSKLNPSMREIAVETPLNLLLNQEQFDARQLREYQNLVYLLDYNSGIFVFDNLGNYKTKPHTGLHYMGFRGNELYFVKENKLYFQDLYSQATRVLELSADKEYISALVGEDHQLYLFSRNSMDIYFTK